MDVGMGYFGFMNLLALAPAKTKLLFMAIYFLAQGVIGPVSSGVIPTKQDIKKFQQSYYQMELAKALPNDTYAYSFLNRLDISSQNFMLTQIGKKLSQIPLKDMINTFIKGEKPLIETKKFIKQKLNLSAEELYSLLQGKLEIALTSYNKIIHYNNILLAYYPQSESCTAVIQKMITELPKKLGITLQSEATKSYTLWKVETPQPIFLAEIAEIYKKKRPFYLISFNKATFKQFIMAYHSKPKNSLYHRLKKEKVIYQMGKGVHGGVYISLKGILFDSNLSQLIGDTGRKVYNKLGIKTILVSDAYQNEKYHEQISFIFDKKQNSVFKKITPLPLMQDNFKWLPQETRLVLSVSFKELPKILTWFGDMVYEFGGKDVYRDYRSELDEFNQESGLNINRLFSLLAGELTFAMNLDKTFLERIPTSLNDMEEAIGLALIKSSIIGVSVKNPKETGKELYHLIDLIPADVKSPIVTYHWHKVDYNKVILKLAGDKNPVSIYWTFLNHRLIVCSGESTIQQVIEASGKPTSKLFDKMIQAGLKLVSFDVMSLYWVDFSFIMDQLRHFSELTLVKENGFGLDKESEQYYFKVLSPMIRDIISVVGYELGVSRVTEERLFIETMSKSGIGTGNLALPFMGGLWFWGMMPMPFSMLDTDQKTLKATQAFPNEIKKAVIDDHTTLPMRKKPAEKNKPSNETKKAVIDDHTKLPMQKKSKETFKEAKAVPNEIPESITGKSIRNKIIQSELQQKEPIYE